MGANPTVVGVRMPVLPLPGEPDKVRAEVAFASPPGAVAIAWDGWWSGASKGLL